MSSIVEGKIIQMMLYNGNILVVLTDVGHMYHALIEHPRYGAGPMPSLNDYAVINDLRWKKIA